jgi:hypothetical protein
LKSRRFSDLRNIVRVSKVISLQAAEIEWLKRENKKLRKLLGEGLNLLDRFEIEGLVKSGERKAGIKDN